MRGSSDKTSSPSAGAGKTTQPAAEPLTKAAFIAQADDICRDVKRATTPFEKQFRQLGTNAEIKQAAPVIQGIVDAAAKGQQRLRALAAPAEDKARLDAYLISRDSTLALFHRLQAALQAGDEKRAETVMAGNSAIDDKEAALAKAYGFKYCGLSNGLIN